MGHIGMGRVSTTNCSSFYRCGTSNNILDNRRQEWMLGQKVLVS